MKMERNSVLAPATSACVEHAQNRATPGRGNKTEIKANSSSSKIEIRAAAEAEASQHHRHSRDLEASSYLAWGGHRKSGGARRRTGDSGRRRPCKTELRRRIGWTGGAVGEYGGGIGVGSRREGRICGGATPAPA
jgi:hypothetical protein